MVYQDKISELSKDENNENRRYAAHTFRYFSEFSDKKEAWADLHHLTQDKDSIVRQIVAFAFRYFSEFPDKKEAWVDLHRLTQDKDSVVRQNAAAAFRIFSEFPDKKEAWADLHRLTQDEHSVVRQNAAFAFRYFSEFPDKKEAWADLHRLTQDTDSVVRQNAAFAFQTSFSEFPDKKAAWADLHRLTQDEDSVVRQNATYAFRIFPEFPDKKAAWADLHRLTQDEDSVVRQNAAYAFRIFPEFPDKKAAWADLHRLTQDEDSVVRQNAAIAFTSFSAFPDKKEAWADLHRLTQDDDYVVRQSVAFVFHCIYEKASKKDEIIELLTRLAEDNSTNVKAMSNYSLARIYVHESSKAQSEQEFINDYNKAIEFFKKAYDYKKWDITEFCFTIHSVFNKILNGDIKNTDDIKKNISKIINISAKSEERKYLLEIVESLGNILEESLTAKKSGQEAWKFREKVLPICDRTDELIGTLNHQGMKVIASKAKNKVKDRYLEIVQLLEKVNNLINKPENLDEQFLAIRKGFCESFHEPEIRNKIKMDIEKIKTESDPEIRKKLEMQQLQYFQYMLEMDRKAMEKEIIHKDDIINIKDKESNKGWGLLKIINRKESPDIKVIESRSNTIKILESLGISVTISSLIWGLIYAFLTERKYLHAFRESLSIAVIFLFLIYYLYYQKKYEE